MMDMAFVLGDRSREELRGVHGHLVSVVELAIHFTPVDFAVHDGLRTLMRQREYVASGVSHTLQSKHLCQPDGTGHAVDLVPYVCGKLRWEWDPIYRVAAAVREAERQILGGGGGGELAKVTASLGGTWRIRWGGVWDRLLEELDLQNLPREREAYRARMRLSGKRAFCDGPHFELHRLGGTA